MKPKTKAHNGKFYQTVKDADDEFLDSLLRRKNYWTKFPDLKKMKNTSKVRIVSYISLSLMFVMSITEFHGVTGYGSDCILSELLVTCFAVFAAFCFEMSIKTFKAYLMFPYMAVVMTGLSVYVLFLVFIVICFFAIPPYHYFLLAFNFFHLGVTLKVLYSFARCTQWLWRAFFSMVDVNENKELVHKLLINALIEEEADADKKKKNKKNRKKMEA